MNLASVILDTNIYLDLWVHNKHQEKLEWSSRRYLVRQSSVVLHELRRGIKTKKGLKLVEQLRRHSPQVFTPLSEDWWKAGEVISRLSLKNRWNKEQRSLVQNDALIALTCRRYGQILVTSNRTDFDLLRPFIDFQSVFW